MASSSPLDSSPLSSRRAPSTWQTRFGKKQRAPTAAAQSEREPSHSIADQLLRALSAREKQAEPEDALSHQCAERLLGKRNAFVPELRMRSHSFEDDSPQRPHKEQDLELADAKAAAHEIIASRFQLESRADALRQSRNTAARVRSDAKTPSHRSAAAAATSTSRAKSTDSKSTTTQQRSRTDTARADAKNHPCESTLPRALFEFAELEATAVKRDAKRTRIGPERVARVAARQTRASPADKGVSTSTSKQQSEAAHTTSSGSSVNPIKRMEARQQRVREMRAERAATATTTSNIQRVASSSASTRAHAGAVSSPDNNNNQNDDVHNDRHIKQAHSAFNHERRGASAAVSRDERLLQDKIERLASENQRAVAIEDERRMEQQYRQIKARVFSLLRKRVDDRRRQEARAQQAFVWRLLLRVWRNWQQCVRALATERAEQETRAQLVRAKVVADRAEAFWCQKQLPKWFYRWLTSVQAAREAHELDRAQQRRKEQAQRLMERLIRGQTEQVQAQERSGFNSDREHTHEPEVMVAAAADATTASPSHAHKHRGGHATATAAQNRQAPALGVRRAAWSSEVPAAQSPDATLTQASPQSQQRSPASSSTASGSSCGASASPAPPPPLPAPAVDPLYVSMQERAAERKQRRELLRQKYEQLEQEKREAIAVQVAEREAQLQQRKAEERERVRERKRQEALAAQEKALRLEAIDAQRRMARRHNARRVMFYYAFLPLKRAWERSKRVEAGVAKWHRLRSLHRTWCSLLQFVHDCHAERKRTERQKLALAAAHYARTLLRQSWRGFQRRHAQVRRIALAVERQAQWNALRRSWKAWQHTLAAVTSHEQRQVQRAQHTLEAAKLRRMWMHWRLAVSELRQERERAEEKEQLWRKVRGWLGESDVS